jgi:GrpB-like predicted nucleotidyltransferase (UPF0157 family)
MPAKIEIVEPRESWANDFTQLKQSILGATPPGAYLHHIGSTAVPGLPAKDVIDIQVTVDHLAQFDIAAFERAGFKHKPGFVDHCPPGLDLPDSDLQKELFNSTSRPANIHIRQKGRFNQRFPLLSRDFLRAHPTAAGAYALIKQRLARRFPNDADAYYDIKDPVFDIIMEGANEWAARVGWSEPPAD